MARCPCGKRRGRGGPGGPDPRLHDECIAGLPGVVYACCGHFGLGIPYVAFGCPAPGAIFGRDVYFGALYGKPAAVAFDERQLWHGARA